MSDILTAGLSHKEPTPPGVKRFDWHAYAFAAVTAVWLVIELDGVRINAQQRKEVKLGLRDKLDYRHRTYTELIRWLGATDRDGQTARFAYLRRMGLVSGLAIGVAHFVTDGKFI